VRCSSCPPNRLSSSAKLGARNGFPAGLFEGKPFQGIEHEIGRLLLGQTAISRLAAGKAPVLGELVDRFAAAANAEILAALPAPLDARLDVGILAKFERRGKSTRLSRLMLPSRKSS
jgi:hypothetical protein